MGRKMVGFHKLRRPAGKGKVRRAALIPQSGNLVEGKSRQPGAAGLEKGFLGRKIGGGSFQAGFPGTAIQELPLPRRKDPLRKGRAGKAAFHAGNLTQIGPDAVNHG